jgi:hypothetical protein
MAKYMVLYYSTMKASQLMANASMDQMKASMAEWMNWKDNASKTAKIEFGLALEAVRHITPEGASESKSMIGGYSIVEGDSKEAIVDLLRTHPHLKRAGASIDLLEMISMPGLEKS